MMLGGLAGGEGEKSAYLPAAGRHGPEERLHRHQEPPLQGAPPHRRPPAVACHVRPCCHAASAGAGHARSRAAGSSRRPSPPTPFPSFPPPAKKQHKQVADVSTSKTGKHGHAKCAFVAIDIFTGKKMEDLSPSSHNVDVPHVSRLDYTLLDITDDGFVSRLPACLRCLPGRAAGSQRPAGLVAYFWGAACLPSPPTPPVTEPHPPSPPSPAGVPDDRGRRPEGRPAAALRHR
jgi:hypothetical protein